MHYNIKNRDKSALDSSSANLPSASHCFLCERHLMHMPDDIEIFKVAPIHVLHEGPLFFTLIPGRLDEFVVRPHSLILQLNSNREHGNRQK